MLLTEVRNRTRQQHEQLERDLSAEHYFDSLQSYRRLLERWYGWLEPWERLAATEAPLSVLEFMNHRWKTTWLQNDLQALGDEPADGLPRAEVPVPVSTASWIGTLYVLEGSTLGGQFISRTVEQELGLRFGRGYSFFRSYGEQVGSRWQEFRQFAEKHVAPDKIDEAVLAAEQTFQTIHGWLCPIPR